MHRIRQLIDKGQKNYRKNRRKKTKLKNNPMTNVFGITKSSKSTSKVAKSYKKRYWKKATVRDFVGRLEEPKP